MKKKYRGQEVEFQNGKILLTIEKPLLRSGNIQFSINDKLYEIIEDQNIPLRIETEIDDKLYYFDIDKDTPFYFRESVNSKFPNAPDWHRYWYKFKPNVSGQAKMEF